MKNVLIIFTLMLLGAGRSYAQLNPMGSMYFLNAYLANPAMAGTKKGMELNAGYKAQWQKLDGGPAMQAITASQAIGEGKVGLGVNFYNEVAGVIRRTSWKGSYAYHLPLDDYGRFWDLGLSAGIMYERLDMNRVRGDLSAPSVQNFNLRKPYFDGDFGMGYRDDHLRLQLSIPNLKRLFSQQLSESAVDRSMYMVSAAYTFLLYERSVNSIEPMVVFRGIENFGNLWDAGCRVEMEQSKLLVSGLYHSTGSVSVGAGTVYEQRLTIMVQHTTNTRALRNYANGEFEIGLKYNISNK